MQIVIENVFKIFYEHFECRDRDSLEVTGNC